MRVVVDDESLNPVDPIDNDVSSGRFGHHQQDMVVSEYFFDDQTTTKKDLPIVL